MSTELVISASEPKPSETACRSVRGEATPGWFDREARVFTPLTDPDEVGCPNCWAGTVHAYGSDSWNRWHTDGEGRTVGPCPCGRCKS